MRDRLRQPTLNAVKAFEAAARLGSLKAAAADQGVTSSAVSHQVRQLEEELGKRLFIRHNNAIELTREGRRLFEEIRPALRTIGRATEAIRRDTQTVAMNVTTWFALRWLIPRLADFQRRHPRILIDMLAVQRPVVLDDSVEMIISYTRVGQAPPAAGAIELLKDFAVPMAAPGLWRDKGGRELDIRNVPLIGSVTNDWEWRTWAAGNDMEFEQLRITHRFDTDYAVALACKAGLGVALITTEAGRLDIKSGQLVPFGVSAELRYGTYWLVTVPRLRRPAEVFVNWLLKVAPGVEPRPPV